MTYDDFLRCFENITCYNFFPDKEIQKLPKYV